MEDLVAFLEAMCARHTLTFEVFIPVGMTLEKPWAKMNVRLKSKVSKFYGVLQKHVRI